MNDQDAHYTNSKLFTLKATCSRELLDNRTIQYACFLSSTNQTKIYREKRKG